MAQLTRTCIGCGSPLPGELWYCGECEEGTALAASRPGTDGEEDPGGELELLRRGLAGRYAIQRAVGAGATARVYLAEDLKHRRKVAVKVLRPAIATRVGSARFLREIEIAARLQHPHILPVYDSGEIALPDAEGRRLVFYVMPYAMQSLASRLARGRVPLADAVRILCEVAEALAYAHAEGVVHRDIKPDNVMLNGRHALVADFGIAKALTVTLAQQPHTRPGVPIGTPYYMSPEQVTGDPNADGRADQYSLGVVAYELLTGCRPFAGRTLREVLAAQVLEQPEPVDRLRPEVPAALARLVMRCLEKQPGSRWQHTEELAEQLDAAAKALGPAARADESPRWLRHFVGGGVIAAGLLLALPLMRGPTRLPAAPMADQLSFDGAIGISAISPDGRFLAYSSRDEGTLLLQEMPSGPRVEIVRGLRNVLSLRWSPDGTSLLAAGRYEGEPGVYLFSRLGGVPRRVGRGRLGQWHPSGSSISVWDYPDKSLLLLDLASGDTTDVMLPGRYDWLSDAEWSPSGRRLAYVTVTEPADYALRVAEKDGHGSRIVVQDTLPIGSPRWVPEENALYYLSGRAELRKQRLARPGGAPSGEPITLLDGMQAAPGEVDGVTSPIAVTADAGQLIYLKGLNYSNLWLLAGSGRGRSRSVSTRRLTSGTALRRGAAVSPDGKWIAYLESSTEGTDLFRMPLDGGGTQRLSFTGRIASLKPAWSPDGTRLAFGIYDSGTIRLGTVGAAGGEVRISRKTSLPAMGDLAWAPGRRILYQVAGNRNYRLLDPGTGKLDWLVANAARGWIFAAHPSPGAKRVAVYWNRRPQGGLWAISMGDTSSPVLLRAGRLDPIGWSADGRSVLALGWDSGGIVRVGLDRRSEDLGTLPFRNAQCDVAKQARPLTLACVVPEQISDVWRVAGFDPERDGQ